MMILCTKIHNKNDNDKVLAFFQPFFLSRKQSTTTATNTRTRTFT